MGDQGADGGVPGTTVAVELTWDAPNADLDVHLLRAEEGAFSNQDDCYYANCAALGALEWPPDGVDGNPSILIDDTNGYGPEYLVLDNPADGAFVAAAHFYSPNGDGMPFPLTLEVFHLGVSILTVEREVAECRQFFKLADVEVSGGGTTVTATERGDAPTIVEEGQCP